MPNLRDATWFQDTSTDNVGRIYCNSVYNPSDPSDIWWVTNETTIVAGISEVRFNVSDLGGDNFIVKAKFKPGSGTNVWDGAETGIMTVWKRILLERTQMTSAQTLDFSDLNPSMEKAFVEFVLTNDVAAVDDDIVEYGAPAHWVMGTNASAASAACKDYVEAPPTGVCTHASEPGWYFLASAEYYTPTGAATQLINPAVDGLSTVLTNNRLYLPIAIPSNQTPDSIKIWKDVAEFTSTGEQYVAFTCYLDTDDPGRRTLGFTAIDFPAYCDPVSNANPSIDTDFSILGFTNGEAIAAEIKSPGASKRSGQSVANADWQFNGRALIFRSGTKSTITHELAHGFGMGHNCGNRDYTGTSVCSLQYGHYWLLKDDDTVDRWVRGPSGVKLCAEHIKAIREARLEEVSEYRKLDW